MAESFVQVATDGAGKSIDTYVPGTYHRQVVVIGDPNTAANVCSVTSSGALTMQGAQSSRTAGTITTSSSVVGPVSIAQYNIATISVYGTYAGVTFIVEVSDDGTNYYPIQVINNSTSQAATTWGPLTNSTGTYDACVGALTQIRVRATAWTSGTANIGISLQTFVYEPVIASMAQGLAASGTTILGAPVLMGGTYTTTLPTVTTGQAVNLQTTARGEALVSLSSGGVAPVVTAASTIAAAASPSLTVALSPNTPLALTTNVLQACINNNVSATGALVAVKASAGNLMGFSFQNNTAAVAYLEFWNVVVGSVTLGTTAPTCIFALPASAALTVAPGAFALLNSTTGMAFAAVTAYNGSTTASVTGSIFYK